MSDITDIVSRLRRTDENRGVLICSEAADTIERLRAELCTAWEQAERWKDERDEARRECCNTLEAVMFRPAQDVAADKGWDCYREAQ